MKRVIYWLFILAVIVLAIYGAYRFYQLHRSADDLSQLPQYYKTLVQACQISLSSNPASYQCCIESVRTMAQSGYLISYQPYPDQPEPYQVCPDRFRENKLDCSGSYKWCEAVK